MQMNWARKDKDTNWRDNSTLLQIGRPRHHSNGAPISMSKETTALYEWAPISDRIITAKFWSRYIKTTVIQVYAPTEDTAKDIF